MGWSFGVAIIDFDFHTVVDKLLEPEMRHYRSGFESPEEILSSAQIDAGTVTLELLGLPASPEDAPISFDSATLRDFDGYAVGRVNGKTVIVGRRLGLDQGSPRLKAAYERVSREYGAVSAFWFNDASDTYALSVFRGGRRVRYLTCGPGMSDDEGARQPGEPEGKTPGHDYQMGLLTAVTGLTFSSLLDLRLEHFCAC